MARLWPAGGVAPASVDISPQRFHEFERILGVTFSKQQKGELVTLCNKYLDWEDLQEAAAGRPQVARKWLAEVQNLGSKLQKALRTGQDHAKKVAATTLRGEMTMNFDILQRGVGDMTRAAQLVLEQNKLRITNETKGPDPNDALVSLARSVAKLVERAGARVDCSGGDGRAPISPFVRFMDLLFKTFPKRSRRVSSEQALAKRLERIIRTADKKSRSPNP